MDDRKKMALAALITNPTIRDAAAAAGIDESTLRRYMKDGSFKIAYNRALSELLQDATRQAHNALCAALEVLKGICLSTEENAQVRVSAARSLLDYALKLREATTVEERLSALEEKYR